MATHACTYRVLFSLHHPVPDLCADQKLIAGSSGHHCILANTHPLFISDLTHFQPACRAILMRRMPDLLVSLCKGARKAKLGCCPLP